MESEDLVTIAKVDYEKLLEDQRFLSYLYAVGVDSWDGYEAAFDLMQADE